MDSEEGAILAVLGIARPAVIVSNDGANATASRLGRGVVTVVAVTTSTDRIYPFQLLLAAEATGLSRDSKARRVGAHRPW